MKSMISGMAKPFHPTKMVLTIRFAHLLYEFLTCIRTSREMILVATRMLSDRLVLTLL